MRCLLDTHLLLWTAGESFRLSRAAREVLDDPKVQLLFSAASIWEISVKRALNRPDFQVSPTEVRQRLLQNGYLELPVTGIHGAAVAHLPLIHKDPFDRLLVAQAVAEDVVLLTADAILKRYPAPVRLV